MTCCFGFVKKRLFYYTLLFTKPNQHVIEIIYGRGKFVGDFNMGRYSNTINILKKVNREISHMISPCNNKHP
jgi:hypothetical protein